MVGQSDKASMFTLLKIAGVSWSLLTSSEKVFFSLRAGIRLALNGLDIIAVGLMGLLGSLRAEFCYFWAFFA